MSLFKSRREKKLWIAVLAVVIGIFLVIFIGRPFAGLLRERGLLSNTIWLALWLVIATVLWHGWKKKVSSLEIGIWLGIIAVYLLMFSRMASPEERSHIIEYGVLAIFIHEALLERNRSGGKIKYTAWLALLISILIGLMDELIQLLIPDRVFDPIDILFNSLASILAIGGSVAIAWIRKKTKI